MTDERFNSGPIPADDEPPTPRPAFSDDLRQLFDARLFIPPDVDDRVLAAADRKLAPIRRKGQWFARWVMPLSTAAMLLLAAGLFVVMQRRDDTSPPVTGVATDEIAGAMRGAGGEAEDIDGNGTVDILDAFALARQIKDAGAMDAAAGRRLDINGDGRVDERDAERIAHRAVRLNGGAG